CARDFYDYVWYFDVW
nr:immunoglobulin heavy chain junction region [Mus musculus]